MEGTGLNFISKIKVASYNFHQTAHAKFQNIKIFCRHCLDGDLVIRLKRGRSLVSKITLILETGPLQTIFLENKNHAISMIYINWSKF